MLFIKFFIYDFPNQHNDFICVYFGDSLEESPIFYNGGEIRNDNLSDYQDFLYSLRAKKEGFVSI